MAAISEIIFLLSILNEAVTLLLPTSTPGNTRTIELTLGVEQIVNLGSLNKDTLRHLSVEGNF